MRLRLSADARMRNVTDVRAERKTFTMKISRDDLKKMIREALTAAQAAKKAPLKEEASSIEKDVLPGSGDLSKLAKEVDDFLMSTNEKAKELCTKLEEEMKVDMLGGSNPSMAPRVGERNRMLSLRVGVLKKLAANCVSIFEFIRREG